MKLKESQLYKLATDIVKTATSKDRLKRLFHIPLYSNALYLMITSAASALLGFIFWIIVARFYTPEDVGLASAAMAAIAISECVWLGVAMLTTSISGSSKSLR